jgi:hypothetical protein
LRMSLEFVYFDSTEIEVALNRSGSSPFSQIPLVAKRILLEEKLRRTEVALNGQLPPAPDVIQVTDSEAGTILHWMKSAGELLYPTFFVDPLSTSVEVLAQQWHLFQIRLERLRETVRLLRQYARLLSLAIRSLLEIETWSRFICQLIRRQRAWYLLHGSHPPRQGAGLCGPDLAQLGRVCCV